nr:DUF4136 domain-containing protein [uncultured Carboxylicivirga sp.]
MKTNFIIALTTICILLLNSCYPGGAEYVDELDTSISRFDPDYNWNNLEGKTYTMPEKIRHIKDGKDVTDPEMTYDEDILEQVNREMQNLGLTMVDGSDQDNIDIVVAITLIEQNNSGSTWIPGGWWGGWYPGWDWGWGGGYPWYPVYYSYKTGSVLIHMGNFKDRNTTEDKVPPIYEGAIDGLLQGNIQYIGDRIERGIDELYNQAPFN